MGAKKCSRMYAKRNLTKKRTHERLNYLFSVRLLNESIREQRFMRQTKGKCFINFTTNRHVLGFVCKTEKRDFGGEERRGIFARWIMFRVYMRCLLVFEVLFSFTFIKQQLTKNFLSYFAFSLFFVNKKSKLWWKAELSLKLYEREIKWHQFYHYTD